MGFGILFVGYLLVSLGMFVPFGFVMRLAGYSLMAIAFLKLKEFNKSFIYPLIASVFMTIYGTYSAVYQGAEKFSISLPAFFETIAEPMLFVGLAGIICLDLAVSYSIYKIAVAVELNKPKASAVRNAAIVGLFGIISVLWISIDSYKKYFGLPMFLLLLVSIVLYLTLIFSCYMYICPEGDEDMPRRESKFEFVNKFRDESERRTEQAVRDTEEYLKKKQKNRIERLEQKNNKKTKK